MKLDAPAFHAGDFDDIGHHAAAVGKENGVELAALGRAGQAFVIADVAQPLGRRVRVAPGRAMVAAAENEQVQVHHGDQLVDCFISCVINCVIDCVIDCRVRHARGCRKRANLA